MRDLLLNTKIALLFPGQGSQSIGMGKALAKKFPIAQQTFSEADDWLGFKLSSIAWEGPSDKLNDTINTQPALLTHSIAALRVLEEKLPELKPIYVAGHSMGELSALVACKALPYREALQLARRRGELMKAAGDHSPGGMAAVLGLDITTLEDICAQASLSSGELEIVQVANDNCPGQVVISGNSVALERAMALAKDSGARRVRRLAVSIPAHSPMMSHAQLDFNQAIKEASLCDPQIPLVGNVTAQSLTKADAIRRDLEDQLTSRVRWTESIHTMITGGATTFIEIGSGSVLSGLLKRIDSGVFGMALGEPEDFRKIAS